MIQLRTYPDMKPWHHIVETPRTRYLELIAEHESVVYRFRATCPRNLGTTVLRNTRDQVLRIVRESPDMTLDQLIKLERNVQIALKKLSKEKRHA